MKSNFDTAKQQILFWRLMREALYEDTMNLPHRNASKLDVSQVEQIQTRWVRGERRCRLAAEYGVTPATISHHVRGLSREMRAAA